MYAVCFGLFLLLLNPQPVPAVVATWTSSNSSVLLILLLVLWWRLNGALQPHSSSRHSKPELTTTAFSMVT